MARRLDELLAIAEHTFATLGIPHALVGACARNVYASPRSTCGIDLAVDPTPTDYPRAAAELQRRGFVRVHEARTDPASELPDVALFCDDAGGRIDLLFACSDFERGAIARATPTSFPVTAITMPVAGVEDLIVYKLLAGRPRDVIDIEEILHARARAGHTLDWSLVERECAEWDAAPTLVALRTRLGV